MESRHRKVGHAPAHGMQAAGEEWCVAAHGNLFPAGFPPTCRSASCASEFKVFGQRRASRKKSPAVRRSDSGSGEEIRRQWRRVLEEE